MSELLNIVISDPAAMEYFSLRKVNDTEMVSTFFLSITNKIQGYRIFYIAVNAVHVSGGKTARNMYSIDNKLEYCITLYLVGNT
jgi:hypothetical protein